MRRLNLAQVSPRYKPMKNFIEIEWVDEKDFWNFLTLWMQSNTLVGLPKTNGRLSNWATLSKTLGLALEFRKGATIMLTRFCCLSESNSPSRISCMDRWRNANHSSFSMGGLWDSSQESQPGSKHGGDFLFGINELIFILGFKQNQILLVHCRCNLRLLLLFLFRNVLSNFFNGSFTVAKTLSQF